jgi:glycosyltransferase involved in cell wall biosynthesis
MPDSQDRVALIGTVGLPPKYGGFESLADNLARSFGQQLTVFCSAKSYPDPATRQTEYLGAKLRYVNLEANGPQSTLYDLVCMLQSCLAGHKTILVLGVSGAIGIPFVRLLFPGVRVVTNIDGMEWKRSKWSPFAKRVLRSFESFAVRYSHVVISDNQAIADHVRRTYGKPSAVIAYGGDHALVQAGGAAPHRQLGKYALCICRIEPENNVHEILKAFAAQEQHRLKVVGNWQASAYGRELQALYKDKPQIDLLDPIYDVAKLYELRHGCQFYVHGHSAGGTNPSLVEIMHFAKPVLAFDCVYNRFTMENMGWYFSNAQTLQALLDLELPAATPELSAIAKRRYTWDTICKDYQRALKLHASD